MENRVLKTYEFHLSDNRIICIRKCSVTKAARSLKNVYNLNLHDVKQLYSNGHKVPYVYLSKVLAKYGKED